MNLDIIAAPAQTLNYMLAGYIVIFGTLVGYIISLHVRWNRLQKEKDVLTESENHSDRSS
jgi:hypothetical protein